MSQKVYWPFIYFLAAFHILFEVGAQVLRSGMQKSLQYLLSRAPHPHPPPSYLQHLCITILQHTNLSVFSVCVFEREDGGSAGPIRGRQRRTITHPQSRWVSHTIVWLLFQLRDSAYTQSSQFPPLPSLLPSTSFLSTQHFLPFYPAISSFLPSTSFLSTQHFFPFYPALPSLLPRTPFLSTQHCLPFYPALPFFLPGTSFLSTQQFLPFYPALPSFLPSTSFLSFFLTVYLSKQDNDVCTKQKGMIKSSQA